MCALRLTSAPGWRLPTAADACRATVSSVATEHLLDLGFTHAVEVIGNGDLPGHEAQPLDVRWLRGVQCDDLDQGFARFGDDKRLAPGGLIDQPGELGFRIMAIWTKSSKLSLLVSPCQGSYSGAPRSMKVGTPRSP
jgi:hypothetical protein